MILKNLKKISEEILKEVGKFPKHLVYNGITENIIKEIVVSFFSSFLKKLLTKFSFLSKELSKKSPKQKKYEVVPEELLTKFVNYFL